MINKSKIRRVVSLSLVVTGFVLGGGHLANSFAQTSGRDPFAPAPWKKKAAAAAAAPGKTGTGTPGKAVKPPPPPIVPLGVPAIEQRINYYKQVRLQAVENGQTVPKVTSVLTLDEIIVNGVVRTPRGYAALVEAKPIDLSYTIYPGEKFFDGQLVAIEDGKLVFRKVTKMSNGKFIASVENKSIREYSDREQLTGTAPIQPAEKPVESAANTAPSSSAPSQLPPAPQVVISPLEEMERQPQDKPKDSAKERIDKKGKKPAKIARNK